MDVIYISSGTEDDSDIEIVSVYNDTEDDSKDVLREWSSIPPPYIDLTDSVWEPLERRYQRREKNSVDWSYNSLSADFGDNNGLSADFGDDSSLSGGEVKPLSSALELATSERAQKKLLCHSPTESGENRDGTPDFVAELVSEKWECSPRRPALEPKEEQKPLACLGGEPGSSPRRSHCRSPSLIEGLWEKEGIPGSPLPSVPEFSRSPQSESKIQPGPVTFAGGRSRRNSGAAGIRDDRRATRHGAGLEASVRGKTFGRVGRGERPGLHRRPLSLESVLLPQRGRLQAVL
ncbi:hypothetical protein COCON_G00040950 [Conger conger]|uniref:Uncharacterized protein n=1 Tax=Conger conger TaxID=82655 RepID=A0A9Q1DTR8_CONCO|nr:hypothetical protein COCON_G00040950 [Conger conger]